MCEFASLEFLHGGWIPPCWAAACVKCFWICSLGVFLDPFRLRLIMFALIYDSVCPDLNSFILDWCPLKCFWICFSGFLGTRPGLDLSCLNCDPSRWIAWEMNSFELIPRWNASAFVLLGFLAPIHEGLGDHVCIDSWFCEFDLQFSSWIASRTLVWVCVKFVCCDEFRFGLIMFAFQDGSRFSDFWSAILVELLREWSRFQLVWNGWLGPI